MAKEKELVIKDWQKGIAPSGHLGFANMVGAEISLTPGVATMTGKATSKTSNSITLLPQWMVMNIDANSTVYALDKAGKVWKADNSSAYATWTQVTGSGITNNSGNGLALWHDYLFVAGDTELKCYGPLSSSPGWSAVKDNSGTTITLNTDTLHPMVAGQDDILYGGFGIDTTNKKGDTLFSLQQVSGQVFAPGTTATYTWTSSALLLSYPYRITSLAELGQNLFIGTTVGKPGTNQLVAKLGDIFPWDRHSASFSLPIRLFESGINAMINIGNQLYISAGNYGQFYLFNGYQAAPWFHFPANMNHTTLDTYSPVGITPQSLMFFKGKLFFGATKGLSISANAGTSGIYSVNLDGTGLTCENEVSNNTTDGSTIIGALMPIQDNGFQYLAGWYNGSSGNVAAIDLISLATLSTGVIDTAIYTIGDVESPTTLYKVDVLLDRNLQVNESIQINYRYGSNDSWITLLTFDYATYGAVRSKNFGCSSISSEQVQFQIILNGTTTSPRLKQLTFFFQQ